LTNPDSLLDALSGDKADLADRATDILAGFSGCLKFIPVHVVLVGHLQAEAAVMPQRVY